MFSFPLQAGAIAVGALSLYRATPGSLAAEELADLLVFADAALRLLLDGTVPRVPGRGATGRWMACRTPGPRFIRRPG